MARDAGVDTQVRALQLLKALVERYIEDGQPVGSRTLSRALADGLSPATIRNVMADLEEQGLIRAPHTSAGRVPTEAGYRLFVDSLLTVRPLEQAAREALRERLAAGLAPEQIVGQASQLLSQLSRLAGVVTLPDHRRLVLRHVEFLPLDERRVLAILVTAEGRVHNRILPIERALNAAELIRLGNFINEHLSGRSLREARLHLIEELRRTRDEIGALLERSLSLAERALEPDEDESFMLAGQTNLMTPELGQAADLERLRELFDSFSDRRAVLELLARCEQAEGAQVFIGRESGAEAWREYSLVAAPYSLDGEVVGVLGVIGPTRMAYDRVIALVDATAQLVGSTMQQLRDRPGERG